MAGCIPCRALCSGLCFNCLRKRIIKSYYSRARGAAAGSLSDWTAIINVFAGRELRRAALPVLSDFLVVQPGCRRWSRVHAQRIASSTSSSDASAISAWTLLTSTSGTVRLGKCSWFEWSAGQTLKIWTQLPSREEWHEEHTAWGVYRAVRSDQSWNPYWCNLIHNLSSRGVIIHPAPRWLPAAGV